MSSRPSGVSWKTHRSVTYSTGWPAAAAYWPLKVRCSTSARNLGATTPSAMTSRPSCTRQRLGATKVPGNTSRLAFWLMLMNPPEPASFGPNRLTLTLPRRSA